VKDLPEVVTMILVGFITSQQESEMSILFLPGKTGILN